MADTLVRVATDTTTAPVGIEVTEVVISGADLIAPLVAQAAANAAAASTSAAAFKFGINTTDPTNSGFDTFSAKSPNAFSYTKLAPGTAHGIFTIPAHTTGQQVTILYFATDNGASAPYIRFASEPVVSLVADGTWRTVTLTVAGASATTIRVGRSGVGTGTFFGMMVDGNGAGLITATGQIPYAISRMLWALYDQQTARQALSTTVAANGVSVAQLQVRAGLNEASILANKVALRADETKLGNVTGGVPLTVPLLDRDSIPVADSRTKWAQYLFEDRTQAPIYSDRTGCWRKFIDGSAIAETPGILRDIIAAAGGVAQLYGRKESATSYVLGMVFNNGRVAEYYLSLDIDGFLSWRGGYTNVQSLYAAADPVRTLVGTFVTTTTNSYSIVHGAYFDVPFTGSVLGLKAFTDNRGGIWDITSATGENFVGSVSVWSAGNSATGGVVLPVTFTTAPGPGSHVARFTFRGDDPAHVPSGGAGTGRGWFRYAADGSETAIYYDDGSVRTMSQTGRLEVADSISIPESPQSITPTGSGLALDWTPSHSGAVGTTRNHVRDIRVDGQSIGSALSGLGAKIEFGSFEVEQEFDVYNSNDDSYTYKLMHSRTLHTFNRYGLQFYHQETIVGSTTFGSGYFGPQMGVPMASLNKFWLPDTGSTTTLSTPVGSDVVTNISPEQRQAAFYSTANQAIIALAEHNLNEMLPAFHVAGDQFMAQRTDGVAKFYTRRFSGDVVAPGPTYVASGRFIIASGFDPATL